MKLAVIGGREFKDYKYLNKILDYIHIKQPITLIISGGARGADSYAEKWADRKGIPKSIHLPDWDTYQKRAGFIRNTQIVEESECVLAMWNTKSRGTADSLRKALDMNKILWVFDYTKKAVLSIEDLSNFLSLIK